MNIYRPNNDEAKVAYLIAKIRNGNNNDQTNIPQGEYLSRDDRLLQHYIAALAEITVSRILNLCWTGCGKGSNGLKDVGNFVEVRSIDDERKGLLVRGKDNDQDPIALVLVDRMRSCKLLGWNYVGEVKSNGRCLDANSDKPAWVMPKTQLLGIESLLELKR